jgi:NAD(P)-dependent dehydrogenase (short-subunit alcohol dehydrogenase family)/acyl carrier protein
MDPILPLFAAELGKISLAAPQIPYVSTLTGTWISAAETTDVDYWVRHLRQPVRLATGFETLLARGDLALLEVGPGRSLSALARSQAGSDRVIVESLRHPEEARDDEAVLLQALARLWSAGVEIDWQGFQRHERRRRVALPAYPFERRRYWLDRGAAPAAPARGAGPADWLYAPVWHETPACRGGEDEELRTWLIFTDRGGLGAKLAGRLAERGHRAVTVLPGSGLTRLGKESYTLDPAAGESYAGLVRELAADPPDRIVHLWTLDEAAGSPLERLEASQTAGFWSLLYLAQALGGGGGAKEIDLTVVSSGLHALTGDEALRPEIATILGPLQVIPLENPVVRARSLDFALPAPGAIAEERLLRQLIAELLGPHDEPVIAWRGLRRWAPRYAKVAAPAAPRKPGLRERGVYLITGGLGGVGLELAGHLASAVQARLVLLSRSGLPPREAWDAPADEPVSPAIARGIRAVRHLESLGAEVLVLRADVSEEAPTRRALDEARRRFGAIHGVIHAAGVAGGGLIALKTPAAASAVLAPKLRGTLVLDSLLAGEALDFFVLCSSLTALLGGIGQVDYTAANAFLDAFAWSRAARGDSAVRAIDWDVWREVGMAVETELPADLAALRQASLAGGMLSREGVEIFGLALAAASPQCIVSTLDLAARAARMRTLQGGEAHGRAEPKGGAGASHARPDLEQAYVEPRNEVEALVADIFRGLLGIDRVGVDDDFFALGGHSLIGLQVISRIQEAFAVELTLRTLFEAPTVAQLAAAVVGARSGRGDGLPPAEPPSEPLSAEHARDRVDQLSDQEVDALLAELIFESEEPET